MCGTVFASLLVLAMMWLAQARGWSFDPSWIALSAIVAGFLVTRLVEAMNQVDENEAASASRAGSVDDLREEDPRDTGSYERYDEDLADLGSGGESWSTGTGGIRTGAGTTGGIPKQPADPFGASGAFDDLRDGYGTRFDNDRRYGR
nr:hypothetical protein GCM10025732_12420 [Glycomyces mayteni]